MEIQIGMMGFGKRCAVCHKAGGEGRKAELFRNVALGVKDPISASYLLWVKSLFMRASQHH